MESEAGKIIVEAQEADQAGQISDACRKYMIGVRFYVDNNQFGLAASIYERIADMMNENTILKWSMGRYAFCAACCYMCNDNVAEAEAIVSKYNTSELTETMQEYRNGSGIFKSRSAMMSVLQR